MKSNTIVKLVMDNMTDTEVRAVIMAVCNNLQMRDRVLSEMDTVLLERTPAWEREAHALMLKGQRVNAIRIIRTEKGWSLKEAIAYSDEMVGGLQARLDICNACNRA